MKVVIIGHGQVGLGFIKEDVAIFAPTEKIKLEIREQPKLEFPFLEIEAPVLYEKSKSKYHK